MKKFSIILFALAMVFAFTLGVSAYNDISDAEISQAVSVLDSLGAVNGYADGGYHPDSTLTRAELTKLITFLLGEEDSITSYSQKTLFSDVTSRHWGTPYINFVYSKGLLKGYGDGSFGPDDEVTYAQLLTVMLRMLDYSESDIGAVYPDDYMRLADKLKLTQGVESETNDSITRGDTALLLVNLLNADTKSGASFYKKIAESSLEDSVILSGNSMSDTGAQNCVKLYFAGKVLWYQKSCNIDDNLIGKSGTVLLDGDEKVIAFLPDSDSFSAVSGILMANSQRSSEGALPYETVMYFNGELSSYPRVSTISQSDVGHYGTLLLDSNGYATAFISDESDVYTLVKNSVLLKGDTLSDKGRKNNASFWINESNVYYERAEGITFGEELIGKSGTLLLDSESCAASFIPDGKAEYAVADGVVVEVGNKEVTLLVDESVNRYNTYVSLARTIAGAYCTVLIDEYNEISAIILQGDNGYVYTDAVLLDNDTISPDGVLNSAKFIIGGEIVYFSQEYDLLSSRDVLESGTLVTDQDNVVLTFDKDGYEFRQSKGVLIESSSSKATFYTNDSIVEYKLSSPLSSADIGQYGIIVLDEEGKVTAFAYEERDEKYTLAGEGILISADTVAPDGRTVTAKFYHNGNLVTYRAADSLSSKYELEKGILLLDSDKEAVGFISGESNFRTEYTEDSSETGFSGYYNDYKLSPNISVIVGTELVTWKSIYSEISSDDALILYFDQLGEIELIVIR